MIKKKRKIIDEKDVDNILNDREYEEVIDPTYDDDIVPEFRRSKKEKERYSPYKTGGGRRTTKR